MLRKVLFTFFTALSITGSAQITCGPNTVQDASKLYEIGRFREAINNLQTCLGQNGINNFNDKIEALRILSMSYLAIDSFQKADNNIEELLLVKDDFQTDARDPERFRNEVDKIRAAQRINLVSSVSKKLEDIRKAPATINIITKEEIEQRGYTDIIEVLQDLPGFDISLSYGVNYATIYQRGLRTQTTEKTLLLVDGVEENDLWTNTADISRQYPLINIKRIEVIYGPASTLYGTNAFVGVINIITKEPEEMVKNKAVSVNAAVGYGSYNSKYADLAVAYKKDIFSFSLTARVYGSDRHDLSSQPFFDYDPSVYDRINYKNLLNIKTGAQSYINANGLAASNPYYNIYGSTGNADSIVLTDAGQARARILDKSAYDEIVLGKKVGFANPSNSYLINAKINIGSFSFGFQKMRRNEAAGTFFTDAAQALNNVYWIPERSYLYMKYERRLSNKLTVTSFSNYRNHYLNNNTRVPTVNNYARKNLGIKDLVNETAPFYNTTYYFLTNKQFRTELKFLYTPSTNFYLVTGIEYRNSQLQGNYLNSTNTPIPEEVGVFAGIQAGGNQFDVDDIGVYAQGSYRFSKYWGITAGTRVDNNNIRQNGGYGTELSPRFVLDYIRKDWVAKIIYSRGVENVSNFTKFSTSGTRIPNPTLGTESIKNFELSVSKKINKYLSVDVDFYESIIHNVVGERKLSATVTQNQNVGQFNIFGVQSNLAYKNKGISIDLNYTYANPKQTQDDNENKVDLRVGDISTHHINGIINYLFFNKLNVNFRTNYMSGRPVGVGTTVPANPENFPGYFISNTAIGLVNVLKNATLQLVCNNLFDRKYFHPGVRTADGIATPSSILQPGRNIFIKLNYEF